MTICGQTVFILRGGKDGPPRTCRGGAAKMEVNTCSLFDDILAAIGDSYVNECMQGTKSSAQRHLKHYIALGKKFCYCCYCYYCYYLG
jgi:hypothetical protein